MGRDWAGERELGNVSVTHANLVLLFLCLVGRFKARYKHVTLQTKESLLVGTPGLISACLTWSYNFVFFLKSTHVCSSVLQPRMPNPRSRYNGYQNVIH